MVTATELSGPGASPLRTLGDTADTTEYYHLAPRIHTHTHILHGSLPGCDPTELPALHPDPDPDPDLWGPSVAGLGLWTYLGIVREGGDTRKARRKDRDTAGLQVPNSMLPVMLSQQRDLIPDLTRPQFFCAWCRLMSLCPRKLGGAFQSAQTHLLSLIFFPSLS